MAEYNVRKYVSCSFCGKRQDQVQRMISGQGRSNICNDCVAYYTNILSNDTMGNTPKATTDGGTIIRCSFCGKRQDHVNRMISGKDAAYICNECIALCAHILSDSTVPQ